MKEIDVCSKPCPQPVIATKNAMEENPVEILNIIVDDEAAKINVTRFAKSRNYKVEQKKSSGGKTAIKLLPPDKDKTAVSAKKKVNAEKNENSTVFFLKTYELGRPDKELGELLMKTLFQTIPDMDSFPSKIVFMHGSVKHTVKDSKTLRQVKKLEALGIDIVVCGTCLDFYGLKDELAVGRISNFFEIASILSGADNTVTL
ncbi:MAG: sulfurtransferase-like selenium metabolism protein YedF [Elusimicrobia bacterium]|jgi:selenium metabolism protein YedF|nr:sulfurtransferase-like selenium metabolism protein YedF [Elusimicrobiota bacterium]